MKKLLSIIIAVSLLSSSAFASPNMVSVVESVNEIEQNQVTFDQMEPALSQADSIQISGPSMSAVVTSTLELEGGNEKPANHLPSKDDTVFLLSEGYQTGDGTKESPYVIATAQQLEHFADSINKGIDTLSYYELAADIDLGGKEWIPVGFYDATLKYTYAFQGSFDGKGFTISNFTISNIDTRYAGFFGLAYNAEIKNVNFHNVIVDVERIDADIDESYAGIVAGRVVSDGAGNKSLIKNCHVTNSSLTLVSDKNSYAGGIVGYAVSGANTSVDIYNTSTDCTINVIKEPHDSTIIYNCTVSGIAGYIGAVTDGFLSIRKSFSVGDINVDSTESLYSYIFAGGIIGQGATRMIDEAGGSMDISYCHSSSNITANGKQHVFTGGFAGNIGATYNMLVFNCYASGNAHGSTTALTEDTGYVAAGGFIGQIDFDAKNYKDSIPSPIYNCYASGDAVDTLWESGESIDSYVGGFTGYSFAPIYSNCYSLQNQTVIGRHPFTPSKINILSDLQATSPDSYASFDFLNTWTMNPHAEYPYPTLQSKTAIATFYSDGELFFEMFFNKGEKISPYPQTPVKDSSNEFVYTFSHWSLTQDGQAYDFENGTFDHEEVVFYAVFSKQTRLYTITFMNEGLPFGDDLELAYGSLITPPAEIPYKQETPRYRYKFEHWALPSNEEIDFSTYTVTKNVELHAVFTEIDKTAWDGAVADSFAEGIGTQALPYVISTAEQLALLAKYVNEGDSRYKDAYYRLGSDINLGFNYWTPIGTTEHPFSANFDGAGYLINRFKLSDSNYMGLFGYVENASISNLYISDFTINVSNYSSAENVYAGGLAAYITSNKDNTIIDSIYVNAASFEVSVDAPWLYAGSLTGYAGSSEGKTLFTNCYATSPVTVSNTHSESMTYAGGLFGYMYTNASGALAKATNCYYTGTVSASAANKSHAGGLAGAVYSHGSSYTPDVELQGDIFAEAFDVDIMLADSFVSADVQASSTTVTYAYAGAIVAEISQYAALNDNVFFNRNTSVTSTGTVETYGLSASETNLTSKTFLSNTLGFDFSSKWSFIDSNKYPVLKVMYTDKPILRISNIDFTDTSLSADITAFARAEKYTVTVSVYNERNQLIALERKIFSPSEVANEFSVSFNGINSPYRIKVSAFDSVSFVPLFPAVEEFL